MQTISLKWRIIRFKVQKSERTIKNKMDKLKEKGYIMRVNGKRNGTWKVMVDIID